MSVVAALAAGLLTLAAFFRLRRTFSEAAQPAAVVLPLAAALLGTLGPAPRAVEAAATTLGSLRAEPFRLADASRRDTVFHLLAWPVAAALGDAPAVRLVASVAAAGALLLGYALLRAAGLPTAASLAGQAALPAVPLLVFGPGAALVARALPQVFLLLLLAHLVRRLGHLEGARDNAAAFTCLLLAQAAGPAATIEVAGLAVLLALVEAAGGARRRAVRLGTSWALAAVAVLAARYLPLALEGTTAMAPVEAALPPRALPWALAATAAGLLAVARLPRHTHAPLVFGTAMVAAWLALAAGIAGVAAADAPGLGLFAPLAAAGVAAAAAGLRTPKTAAAPGSRS